MCWMAHVSRLLPALLPHVNAKQVLTSPLPDLLAYKTPSTTSKYDARQHGRNSAAGAINDQERHEEPAKACQQKGYERAKYITSTVLTATRT